MEGEGQWTGKVENKGYRRRRARNREGKGQRSLTRRVSGPDATKSLV